ncbi:MAG: radical SAM protein [Candidatus Thermoplasmatota archaeon]
MEDVLLIYPPILEVPANKNSERLYYLLSKYSKKIGFFGLSSNVDALVPPVALLSIAQYLKERGYTVNVLDLIIEEREGKNPYNVLKNYLKNINPQIVGISAMEMCLEPLVLKIVDIVKNFNQNIKVVLGGVNASSKSDYFLSKEGIDFIVHGEGEKTFFKLCEALNKRSSLKEINGISYKRKNKIFRNPGVQSLKPEEIPSPDRDIYPFERLYKLNGGRDLIYTSRGCPYNCSFCNAPQFWNRQWKGRKIEKIIEELKVVKNKGANIVHFWDLNFGTNKEWVEKLCSAIKNEDIEIQWDCELRISDMSQSFLDVISSSGCRGAYCGIESSKQSLLNDTNKGYSINDLEKTLKKASKNGITVEGGYVIGLPGDNTSSIKKTNKLSEKLFEKDLSIPLHFLFIPFKGTAIGDNPSYYGIKIINNNPMHFHFISPRPIASTKFISAEKVYKLWEEGEKKLIKIAEKKLDIR